MKVICEEAVYCLPEKRSINLLADNMYKDRLIKCLQEYFGKKKKTYCQVFNDDEQRILYDELDFIYLPYSKTGLEQNFVFSPKSLFNIEITKIIENNGEQFQSIEHIRNDMHELLSDRGITQLRRILSTDLPVLLDMKMENFDIGKLLEMLSIDVEELSVDLRYMICYNLMLYLNRDKNCIVYIDFPLTEAAVLWMKEYVKKGIVFLVNNDVVDNCYALLDTCSFIAMSDKNFVEEICYEMSELPLISYVFHPFVQEHMDLQNKKIKEYDSQLSDGSTTFYLMFDRENAQIVDN